MSPIGRIFIVLNLALAGAFVGFSGTYLQSATDWKAKYEKELAEHQADNEAKDQQIAQLSDEKNDESRKLAASNSTSNHLKSKLADADKENERLSNQLSSMEADLKSVTSSYATVSSSIDRAVAQADTATKNALAHLEAKNDAVRKMTVAQSDLKDANNKISHLEETILAKNSSIGEKDATIKEQGILLAIYKVKAPGIIQFAQPDLTGTVQHVGASGKLLTVTVTKNPAEAEIEKGYRFAIYNNETYKGEAVITEVDGNNAFCRFDGKGTVKIGDVAKTHVN